MLDSTLELLMIRHCVPLGQATFKWGQVKTEIYWATGFHSFPALPRHYS